jgi:putative transposase
MSRPVRIEFPGAHYYVTSKGVDEQDVFVDEADRNIFLGVLEAVVHRFGWLLHSFVLMDSHYHIVVEVPEANLSRGMRQLNGVYTQHFNRRHQREGSLFHGRFRSILIEPEAYLLPVCRHVVLNPVRVSATRSATSYRWSSHRATAGIVKPPAFLHTEAIRTKFGKGDAESQKRYLTYVKNGIGEASPLLARSSQVLLGSPAFVGDMQPILNGERLAKRGPKQVRRKRSLGTLFKQVESMSRLERNELIKRAHIDHGYTLMEVGDFLGIHYTTVSKVVNR